MKEEIAHIIANHIDYETHGKWTLPVMTGDKVDMVASEIDTLTMEHYFEFVEWLIISDWGLEDDSLYYLEGADAFQNIVTKGMTLDELYNYWLKNIKDK